MTLNFNRALFARHSARNEENIGQDTGRLINMYTEGSERGLSLKSMPGLISTATLGSGRVRAMESTADGIYACVDGQFVLWNGSTVSVVGSLPNTATTMARVGSQIGVAAGGQFFIWDGTTLSPVGGQAFSQIGSVDSIDQTFLLTQADGQAYAYSSAGDGKTFDALDFASAEYAPDNLQRVIVVGGLIWFLGAETVEPWQNAGSADLPFTRVQSTILEKGLLSSEAAGVLDNTMMWVSSENRPYRQSDFRPVLIGTDAVCAALAVNSGVSVLPFQWRRHDFLALRFDNAPAWVYDVSMDAWSEMATAPELNSWDVTATVHHDGEWYAGTRSGELCRFGGFNDRGQEFRREAVSVIVSNAGNRFTVNGVDLRLGGAGDAMWSYSRDGGHTFTREKIKPFGASYDERFRKTNMGQMSEFAFRIACTDDTEFTINEAGIAI